MLLIMLGASDTWIMLEIMRACTHAGWHSLGWRQLTSGWCQMQRQPAVRCLHRPRPCCWAPGAAAMTAALSRRMRWVPLVPQGSAGQCLNDLGEHGRPVLFTRDARASSYGSRPRVSRGRESSSQLFPCSCLQIAQSYSGVPIWSVGSRTSPEEAAQAFSSAAQHSSEGVWQQPADGQAGAGDLGAYKPSMVLLHASMELSTLAPSIRTLPR